MSRIGIMQGRLVPPVDGRIQAFPRTYWADEFRLAEQAGLGFIEWIYDEHGADVNPIATDDGVDAMLNLADRHGVSVVSVCADYFMERPLVRATHAEVRERLATLRWLLQRCGRLGIKRVVLPFVDASAIETDSELAGVVASLHDVLPEAESRGIELHLETSLGPGRFSELLAQVPQDALRVNYDIGNSASLGYQPGEEFEAYGDRVGSVHIKDRKEHGSTVPLGDGDADFVAVFDRLHALDYRGDFVLQVARGAEGDEVAWAKRNRACVERFLADAGARGAA